MNRALPTITLFILLLTTAASPAAAAPAARKPAGVTSDKAATALPTPPAGFTDPTTGMEFVIVKGGCFKMGDNSRFSESDEKPVHEVCVSDFAIGKYEVTNAQFRRFMPAHSSGNYRGLDLNGDNQPVVNVSYQDEVLGFINWLRQESHTKYRLPTEAEWEYAARAGTTGRNYWGNTLGNPCAHANVHDMTSKRTFRNIPLDNITCNDGYTVSAPVGSFKANAFGLYDMMGNVWEWTSDWYGPYGKEKQQDPLGPKTGWARVTRGGSWYDSTRHVRAAKRSYIEPGFRVYNLGFRLVAPLP